MTKPVGLTKDVGWQIGVSRTVPVEFHLAWKLLTSDQGLKIWLGEAPSLAFEKGETYTLTDKTKGEIRVFHPNSHLRMTWQPMGWYRASTIQVRVTPKGEQTLVSFHQEHLPGPEEREERRSFYKSALNQLEEIIRS